MSIIDNNLTSNNPPTLIGVGPLVPITQDNPIATTSSTIDTAVPPNFHANFSYHYKPAAKGPDFKLRPFQQDAINRVEEAKTLLLTAPTGAGKTSIAYAAMMKALYEGRTFIYTAPLKAINEQKQDEFKTEIINQLVENRELWKERLFAGIDLSDETMVKERAKAFADNAVGLITGDRQTKGYLNAPVKIMTTEIYNMMSQRDFYQPEKEPYLKSNRTVVFDENHYLGDPDRGWVWEESIMFTPDTAQIIGLSATVGNAQELTDWMKQTVYRKIPTKVELIQVPLEDRPVPLKYFSFNKQSNKESKMQVKSFNGKEIWSIDSEVAKEEEAEAASATDGEKIKRIDKQLVALTKILKTHDKLPAIFFRFSRAGCDVAVDEIASDPNIDLVTEDERSQIEAEILKAQQEDEYLKLEDTSPLLQGVAAHHAEHLPSYKKLVEKLFEKGLIKAVCATSTLAAGINMPARTVVITDLERRTSVGNKVETFSVSAVKQMSGRAGRPGLNKQSNQAGDQEGNVIFMCDPNEEKKIQTKYINAQPEKIISNLKPHYQTLFTMLDSLTNAKGTLDQKVESFIKYYSENSLLEFQTKPGDLDKDLPARINIFKDNYKAMIKLLWELNYITDTGQLTAKGKIAKEIKFGNPIFITEFIYKIDEIMRKEKLSVRLGEFAALMSMFAQDESTCEEDELQKFMDKTCESAKATPGFMKISQLFNAFIGQHNAIRQKQLLAGVTTEPLSIDYGNFYAVRNWTGYGENSRGLNDLEQFRTIKGENDPPGKALKGLQRVLKLLGYLNKAKISMGTSMPFPRTIKECLEKCLETKGRSPAIFKRGILNSAM